MAHSSVEAEYRVIAQGICEVIWVENLKKDLNILVSSSKKLYSDSKLVISIVNNPLQHNRMKHVRINQHFVE